MLKFFIEMLGFVYIVAGKQQRWMNGKREANVKSKQTVNIKVERFQLKIVKHSATAVIKARKVNTSVNHNGVLVQDYERELYT